MAELRKRDKKVKRPQDEPTKPVTSEQIKRAGSPLYWIAVAGLLGCAVTFSGLIPLRPSTRLPPALKVPPRTGVVLGADIQKRDAVVAAFRHAYSAYERDAFGADEYHPLGRKGSNLTAAGGIGYTIADSLDTIILMQQQGYDFDVEYERARNWIQDTLSFDRDANFNTFETTIRVLGGLLSAHYLTTDNLYLDRARELADRIMPVFETPSGLPTSMVNLCASKNDGVCVSKGVLDKDNNNLVSVAEVATLQLEFKYLSFLTDEDSYWRTAEKVECSRGDSYYEYLLYVYQQPF
ncbi:mannosyl-oligosaccharide alpha-1,2-mannosidase [Ceratobasidium sp. 392]|nr:mannosyl-oligosaccharide alpha-1,2-mannosidase [Ceratobasidium sp. 392]